MGRPQKNLTGQQFGSLVAITATEERIGKSVVWECRCDCGNTVFIASDSLQRAKHPHCDSCEKERWKRLGESHAKDLTGQRFGRLVAIRPTEKREQGRVVWECLCDCGKTYFGCSSHLTQGKVKSCGCLKVEHGTKRGKSNAKDLTGQRFGRLVAVRPADKREVTSIVWECLCDCGNYHFATSGNLLSGGVKSCGCLMRGRKRVDRE